MSQQNSNRSKSVQKVSNIAFPSQNRSTHNDNSQVDLFGGEALNSGRAMSSDRNKNRSQDQIDTFGRKKSAAHHKMFDSSQAPWGVERPP